jgi:excisionase family DNA binding protein
MNAELFDKLTDELAEQTVKKIGPKLLEWLDQQSRQQDDPILTAAKAAERLGLSDTKVRQLVQAGFLKSMPGLIEIRIRQSVVDSYGKENPSPRKK